MAKKTTTRRKALGRKKTRAKSALARGASLSRVSIGELQSELARRQRQVGTLERKRERLAEQLEAVEAELAELGALGGITVGGVRKRPQNDMNLAEALAKTLKGKTMSVTDVTEAVQKQGYRTSAANFRTIVNQTLIKDKRFKKVSRGQYTAK